jgi:hypothetical protein
LLAIALLLPIAWVTYRFIVPYINSLWLSPAEAMFVVGVLTVVVVLLINSANQDY